MDFAARPLAGNRRAGILDAPGANIARIQAAFEAACGAGLLVGRAGGPSTLRRPTSIRCSFTRSSSRFSPGTRTSYGFRRNSAKNLPPGWTCSPGVLQRHPGAVRRLLVVRYGHDDKVTTFFSGLCNVRVIWGGDGSNGAPLNLAIPMPPHALELAFAGKFSVAVLNAGAGRRTPQAVARAFGTTPSVFNQQGLRIAQAGLLAGIARGSPTGPAPMFWEAVQQAAAEMLPPTCSSPVDVMNRFVAVCSMAADAESPLGKAEAANHAFTRVTVSRLDDVVARREANTGNGLFYEVADAGLVCLVGVVRRLRPDGCLLMVFPRRSGRGA